MTLVSATPASFTKLQSPQLFFAAWNLNLFSAPNSFWFQNALSPPFPKWEVPATEAPKPSREASCPRQPEGSPRLTSPSMGPGFYVISSVSPLSVWPIFSAVSVCLSPLVWSLLSPPPPSLQHVECRDPLQYLLSSRLALLGFDF